MQAITDLLASKSAALIVRKGDAVTYEELHRQLDEARKDLALTRAEHEQHLESIRLDRDNLKTELDSIVDWMTAVTDAIDRDVPSITAQSPWKVGFFKFGKLELPNVRYFNCSVITKRDGDWLIARRSKHFSTKQTFPPGLNDLIAFHLNDEHVPTHAQPIVLHRRYKDEQAEDPRAMWMMGKLYVSATTFQVLPGNKWTGCHQIVAPIGDQWLSQRLHDPEYGKNGATLYMQKGNEKNWLWFEHDGKPHLIYLTVPHEVVRFSEFFEKEQVHITDHWNLLWMHGEPRGGTPPVRVGDEYFSFYHSSTPWIGKKRRYHMGAYAFEAKPPFRVTRASSLPILSGSKRDPWSEGLPLVVFPCGALLRDNKWFVTLGVNDMVSAWLEIPHEELLPTLRQAEPVKEKPHDPEIPVEKEEDERDATLTQARLGDNSKFVGVAP